MTEIAECPKTALNRMIKAVIEDAQTPTQAKLSAVSALLANIEAVDLKQVCEALGWKGKDDTNIPSKNTSRLQSSTL